MAKWFLEFVGAIVAARRWRIELRDKYYESARVIFILCVVIRFTRHETIAS